MNAHRDVLAKTNGCPPEVAQCWVMLHNFDSTVIDTIGFMEYEAEAVGLTVEEWQQTSKYALRDMLFIPSMSRMEYTFIRVCKTLPDIPPAVWMNTKEKNERTIYLKDLVREAGAAIDDHYLWEFAINFRNDVVHFNAIGRQSMVLPKQIEFPLNMSIGVEAAGQLLSIPGMLKSLEASFFDCIYSYIK